MQFLYELSFSRSKTRAARLVLIPEAVAGEGASAYCHQTEQPLESTMTLVQTHLHHRAGNAKRGEVCNQLDSVIRPGREPAVQANHCFERRSISCSPTP